MSYNTTLHFYGQDLTESVTVTCGESQGSQLLTCPTGGYYVCHVLTTSQQMGYQLRKISPSSAIVSIEYLVANTAPPKW